MLMRMTGFHNGPRVPDVVKYADTMSMNLIRYIEPQNVQLIYQYQITHTNETHIKLSDLPPNNTKYYEKERQAKGVAKHK